MSLAKQIDRVKDLEQRSRIGISMLAPSAQPCIETARILYCGIVDEVEKNGYDVFGKRATTSTWRRLRVAGIAFIQTLFARMR